LKQRAQTRFFITFTIRLLKRPVFRREHRGRVTGRLWWDNLGLFFCYYMCNNAVMNKRVTISTAKLTAVGNSVGICLPKEVLALLRIGKGDSVCLTETPDGVLLTPYSTEFAEIMEAAEIVMREDRDVLKILAK
jgi:putative addiction module antidote